jgi:hypothetical protein
MARMKAVGDDHEEADFAHVNLHLSLSRLELPPP